MQDDIQLTDTHCHIQFSDYGLDADEVWQEAIDSGVTRMMVVGCDKKSSREAVQFASNHDGVWAVVGVHPHYASQFLATEDPINQLNAMLQNIKKDKVVAIGEFGLDYSRPGADKEAQKTLCRLHLDLAKEYDLPVMLHIRDAFSDFWPIFDEYQGLRGVVHCFTAHTPELEEALSRGLYVALNGIMTFTSDEEQLKAAKKVPLDRLLLETDAPYLTPKPFRGKICKPSHTRQTAEFLASLRGEDLQKLSQFTTNNATILFDL